MKKGNPGTNLNIKPGTQVWFCPLKLQFAKGNEATEVVTIRGNENTTDENILVNAGIFSWPVPVENPIVFDAEGLKKETITQILNQHGKVVQEWSQNEKTSIELNLPESGIFFLRTNQADVPYLRLVKP